MKNLLQIILCVALLSGLWGCEEDRNTSGITINNGENFVSLDGLARSGKLTVRASAPWQVTPKAGSDWVRLSATEGNAGTSEITITLQANEGAARTTLLIFVCGGETLPFRVSQSAKGAGFANSDYNFYITFGTMPALYAGLYLLAQDRPSYFFYGRTKTFDAKEFPAYATVTTGSDPNSDATREEIKRMRTEMKSRIREINAADPTAVFGLYVDDLRCRIGYDWFVEQGIDSARVRVSMLSDGTATYNNFYAYFGNPATAETNWNQYAAEVEALDWNHGGRYPETRAIQELESWTWPYYLATRPGYRLVLQDGKLLESSGDFMTQQLTRMQIESIQPYQLLSALPQGKQQQFYRMANFDYDHFAGLFDASPKKNLIIIGTSHRNSSSEEAQRRYVSRIVEQYGVQYDIFFKPHPADKSSADYEKRFGLTLLPGQMPFEIFVWSLLDKIEAIGGYPSTVFLSVPVDKVRFLFAADAASLVHPLNLLFRDATDVEYIQ